MSVESLVFLNSYHICCLRLRILRLWDPETFNMVLQLQAFNNTSSVSTHERQGMRLFTLNSEYDEMSKCTSNFSSRPVYNFSTYSLPRIKLIPLTNNPASSKSYHSRGHNSHVVGVYHHDPSQWLPNGCTTSMRGCWLFCSSVMAIQVGGLNRTRYRGDETLIEWVLFAFSTLKSPSRYLREAIQHWSSYRIREIPKSTTLTPLLTKSYTQIHPPKWQTIPTSQTSTPSQK